jgi:uncharacterized protein (DUF1697 family)
MGRYALLLRGVNVGTKNSLPMADLRSLLEECGCTEVSTYIQSGNAALTTALTKTELTKSVGTALERRMRRPVATTVRTRKELERIVAGNPFEDVATTPRYLCVTFLSEPLAAEARAALDAADFGDELYHVSRHEIYTWHPRGQARSALAEALAKLPLRGTMTTRNWTTVLALHAMLDPD